MISTSSAGTTTRIAPASSVTRPVRPLTSAMRPSVPSVRLRAWSPTRAIGAGSPFAGRLRVGRRRLGPHALRAPLEGGELARRRRWPAAGDVPLPRHLAAHLGDLALGSRHEVIGRATGLGEHLGRLLAGHRHARARTFALRAGRLLRPAGPLEGLAALALRGLDPGERGLHRGRLG